jgi:hypothetical protein
MMPAPYAAKRRAQLSGSLIATAQSCSKPGMGRAGRRWQ